MKRSSVYARGGFLLILMGGMLTLPSTSVTLMGDPFGLGDEWRSPIAVIFGLAVVGMGLGLFVTGMRMRWADRAAARRATAERRAAMAASAQRPSPPASSKSSGS